MSKPTKGENGVFILVKILYFNNYYIKLGGVTGLVQMK